MDYAVTGEQAISQIDSASAGMGLLLGMGMFFIVFLLIILIPMFVLSIIGMCKTFKKAGKPAWAAIVPIYNIVVLLEIIKMDWWHVLIVVGLSVIANLNNEALELIGTIGGIVYTFIFMIKLSKAFGKSAGFGVLTAFFPYVGLMILGCGKDQYQG